jgi:hypothetical protein
MQVEARIPPELINVLVATALLFLVATPAIRAFLHWRAAKTPVDATPSIARSYGGGSDSLAP